MGGNGVIPDQMACIRKVKVRQYLGLLGFSKAEMLILHIPSPAGAPWNAIDKQGQCAGEYAMEEGHQEAFDILLDAGQSTYSAEHSIP